VTEVSGDPALGGGEVVRVSVAAGVVGGLLSLLDPPLTALTATMAVLAVVGWVERTLRLPPLKRGAVSRTSLPALTVAGLGAVAFVLAGGIFAPWKGVVLGVALVPLGWGDRPAARGGAR
jgi:hypothetical protein